MEHRNRTNDLHPSSSNLLPASGGIPAAGKARLVMEASFSCCLGPRCHCRQHGWLMGGSSRPSPLLKHQTATHWPFIPSRAGSGGMMWQTWPSRRVTMLSLAPSCSSCSPARPSRIGRLAPEGYKREVLLHARLSSSFFLSYHSQHTYNPEPPSNTTLLNIRYFS